MTWWDQFWLQASSNFFSDLGIAIVVVVAGVILTIVKKNWRKKIWGNVGRFFQWVWSWRINGEAKRDSLVQQGYDKRDAEVKKERTLSPRPTWRLSNPDGDDIYYIHNSEYWVSDLVVHADPAFFVFEEDATEAFIKGRLGDNTRGGSEGKQFRGQVTARGRKEGVTFGLSWTDQHGDPQPETKGDLPSTVKLAAVIPRPVVQPTWQIGKPKSGGGKDVYVLANGAPDSVTNNVVIDAAPAYFTFMVKKELGDLVDPGYLPFAGRPTDGGAAFGVTFWVTYEDANGDEHTDDVLAKFGFSF